MAAAPEYDYVVVNEDGKIDETADRSPRSSRKRRSSPRHYDL